MSSPEPFPVNHNAYSGWVETPSETALRHELRENALLFGEVRSFGSVRLPLADIVDVQDGIPDIDSDATHIQMQSYERHDHAVFTDEIPEIGLTITLIERETYRSGEQGDDPIEPLRFSLGMSESPMKPGVSINAVVPSRAATTYASYAGYPRSAEETQPPHARIQIGKDVTADKLIAAARLSLSSAPPNPRRDPNFPFQKNMTRLLDRTQELFAALGVDQLPADDQGNRTADVVLTDDMMNSLRIWNQTYFGV